jgi:hypothetical protein
MYIFTEPYKVLHKAQKSDTRIKIKALIILLKQVSDIIQVQHYDEWSAVHK